MQLELDPRWVRKLANLPESGMGYQRVRVRLKAGETIEDALVFNAAILQVADTVAPFSAQGIVIQMYYTEHGLPHFHAVYGDRKISVEMQTGLVRGSFPPRALQHVREWAQLHHAELLANWERAREGRPLDPIAPLE